MTRTGTDLRVGDRVRTTRPSWGDDLVPVGAVGTVVHAPPLLAVAFDHDPVGDGTGRWAMCQHQVTPIARSAKARARLRRRYGPAALMLCALTTATLQEDP